MNECDKISNLVQFELEIIVVKSLKECLIMDKEVLVLYDTDMQQQLVCGISLENIFWPYINQLPNNVYLSIDIDGLEPLNCSKYRNSSSKWFKIRRIRTPNIYDCKSGRKNHRF